MQQSSVLFNMFDVIKFIKEISKRNSIWNKKDNDYCDREKKMEDWFQICEIMYEGNYMSLAADDKYEYKKELKKKWRSIRDGFVRDLRTPRKIPHRKYMYSDHLFFLLPIYQSKKYAENIDDLKTEPNSEQCWVLENDQYDTFLPEDLNESDIIEEKSLTQLTTKNVRSSWGKRKLLPDTESRWVVENDDIDFCEPENTELHKKSVRLKEKKRHANLRTSKSVKYRHSSSSSSEDDQPLVAKQEAVDTTMDANEKDDDRLFLLSMLPMMKKLKPEQNIQSRIELMQVLQKHLNYSN